MARLTVLIVLFLFAPFSSHAVVLTGIDLLEQHSLGILAGKKTGLITNHTGRSRDGRSTIDILSNAHNVRLTALFSPEHGIRGHSDAKISSGVDAKTGLTVHSLYGTSCRPSADGLAGLDILVFDIQDIGTRYYTYIGTLYHAMRAARDAGIPIVVLDRPNPLGGIAVEGAVPETDAVRKLLEGDASGCRSLTAVFPLPTRHGMTVGELARMFNTEAKIGAELHVIKMEGWKRRMLFSDTGLPWINPSPNMKTLDGAILYSGPGFLESTNLSMGRGTAIPFEIFGAPWLDAGRVSRNLNRSGLTGVSFSAVAFTPAAPGHSYNGKRCGGIRVHVYDRRNIDPQLIGLTMMREIRRIHGKKFQAYRGFGIQSGDKSLWNRIADGLVSPDVIAAEWRKSAEAFREKRRQYLLYEEEKDVAASDSNNGKNADTLTR